jgi:hypothetical protein
MAAFHALTSFLQNNEVKQPFLADRVMSLTGIPNRSGEAKSWPVAIKVTSVREISLKRQITGGLRSSRLERRIPDALIEEAHVRFIRNLGFQVLERITHAALAWRPSTGMPESDAQVGG